MTFCLTSPELRKQFSQWMTPAWAAEEIVDNYFRDLTSQDLVVEPSCGEGAFLLSDSWWTDDQRRVKKQVKYSVKYSIKDRDPFQGPGTYSLVINLLLLLLPLLVFDPRFDQTDSQLEFRSQYRDDVSLE